MVQTEAPISKDEAIDIARKYKSLLTEHFKFSELLLYGSYAIGTANSESDIDIAVVVESSDDDYFAQVPILWKLRRQIDIRIEPILIDKCDDKLGFLDDIKKYGIVIN